MMGVGVIPGLGVRGWGNRYREMRARREERRGLSQARAWTRWEQNWMGRERKERVESQSLVVMWVSVTWGVATSVTVMQEPEHRDLGVRRGWGEGWRVVWRLKRDDDSQL